MQSTAVVQDAMAKVFVSYRRADNAAGYAMDLASKLRDAFGERHVFRDMRSIPPGVDFGDYIRKALQSCTVMLVVIGRHWTAEKTEEGRPRLFEPNDWVRIEVATALAAAHVRVVPVLVGGAVLPRADQLPPDLQPLVNRNAVSLEDRKWESDVAALIADLEQVPGLRSWWERLRRGFGGKDDGAKRRVRQRLGIAVAAIVAVVAVLELAIEENGGFTDWAAEGSWGDVGRPVITQVALPPAQARGSYLPSPAAPVVEISGLWIDGGGNRYVFSQGGGEVTIRQIDGPGAAMGGGGSGRLQGGTFQFDFYLNGMHSSSGTVVLSPDASTMQGSFRDSMTGMTMPLYLQRL